MKQGTKIAVGIVGTILAFVIGYAITKRVKNKTGATESGGEAPSGGNGGMSSQPPYSGSLGGQSPKNELPDGTLGGKPPTTKDEIKAPTPPSPAPPKPKVVEPPPQVKAPTAKTTSSGGTSGPKKLVSTPKVTSVTKPSPTGTSSAKSVVKKSGGSAAKITSGPAGGFVGGGPGSISLSNFDGGLEPQAPYRWKR